MVFTPNTASISRNYRPALKKGLSTASLGVFSRKNIYRYFRKAILGKNFWKNYFKVYDTLNESHSYRTLLNRLLKTAQIEDGNAVLDAGCGTGNIIPLIEQKDVRYVGIDIIPEAMEIAKAKKNGGVKTDIFYCDITEGLDIGANSFDRIISNNVIYILSNKGRDSALKEFHRVLKPGGRLVISTLKNGFDPRKIYVETFRMEKRKLGMVKTIRRALKWAVPSLKILFYNYIIKNKQKKGAYKYFTRHELKALLESHGFKEITSRAVYAGEAVLVTCLADK